MEIKQTVRTKDALGVPRIGGRIRRPRTVKRPIEPILVEPIDEKPIDDEPIKPVLVLPIDDKPIQPILICPIPEDTDDEQEILQRLPTGIAA